MVRTLCPLVVCVLVAVCLASPQQEVRRQQISPQQQQQVLLQQQQQQQQQQRRQPSQQRQPVNQQQQQQQQRALQQQQQQQQRRLPPQQRQQQQQQRTIQPQRGNALEQVQLPSLGILAGRSDLNLPAISDVELQRFMVDEKAVTEMVECFITPSQCSSKREIKIIKQVRGLGPGGACTTCTKEEQDKLHQLIYDFMQYFIMRYPVLWRRVIPHLGNLITFAAKN